jgi:hypothetical protein
MREKRGPRKEGRKPKTDATLADAARFDGSDKCLVLSILGDESRTPRREDRARGALSLVI